MGLNTFAIVVDSAVTQEQSTYTVYIGRGTTDQGGWKAGDDLDTLRSPGNTSPTGAWSDGATMWIADSIDSKLYAYTLADGSHDSGKDITLESNNNPAGVWSDGTTVWVAELMPMERRVYAYTLADGSRDSDKDITLRGDNTTSWGIWSDGTTMWVVDWNDDELYAYTLADDARDSDKDITLHGDNTSPRDIWSDGTTIWVVESTGAKLYAYDLSGGNRVEGHDIGLHSSNAGAGGIWADDDTAWVVSSVTEDGSPFDRVFTYNSIPVRVSFGRSSYTVAEGSSVTVKVTLSADPKRQVVIPLTAMNQGGATSADHSGVPADLTFDSGDTEKTFSFSATQDTVYDDGEGVEIGFGSLPAGVTASGSPTTTVSISDDDSPGAPRVTLTLMPSTINESGAGNASALSATLSATSTATTTVIVSVAPSSGVNLSGTALTITAGQTSGTGPLTITAVDNSIHTGDRKVTVSGSASNNVGVIDPDDVTLTIIEDDDKPVSVSFGQSSYTVSEGSGVTVTVVLYEAPGRSVTVPIVTTEQNGISASDYGGVPASVTFEPTDTQNSFVFDAFDDSDDDDGESVELSLGSLPEGVSGGATTEAVVHHIRERRPCGPRHPGRDADGDPGGNTRCNRREGWIAIKHRHGDRIPGQAIFR